MSSPDSKSGCVLSKRELGASEFENVLYNIIATSVAAISIDTSFTAVLIVCNERTELCV